MFQSKTKPWGHQLHGHQLIYDQPATLLAWEMGTGKTKAVVDAICNMDDCRKILILCPKSVIDTWPAEFTKHGHSHVTVVPLYNGSIRKRAREANRAMLLAEARNEKIAIIINYEAAWRTEFAMLAMDVYWDMVVADECHRIKAPGGKISWFMKRLSKMAKRRVGLSGTPMPHSPLDVYAIYRFLDPTIYGTSNTRFKSMYAVMGGFQKDGIYKQVVGFQNLDDLHEKFYSIAHRVKKADVLDLPEVVHERRIIHLSDTARKLYDELKAEFIADVGSGVITAANALSRLLRLQQITSGFGVIETGDKVEVDQGKYNALLGIFTDLDSKESIVVFCRFTRDIEQTHKAAKKAERKCCELSGHFNELAEWKESTGGEVLAVQIQAGGVGVDLSRAAYCCYFSLGFSLGNYEQSLARLHRPGQTRSITYLHLVAKNTVDEKVYTALRKRRQVVEEILAQIKENK